jgi:hypothetical protein
MLFARAAAWMRLFDPGISRVARNDLGKEQIAQQATSHATQNASGTFTCIPTIKYQLLLFNVLFTFTTFV